MKHLFDDMDIEHAKLLSLLTVDEGKLSCVTCGTSLSGPRCSNRGCPAYGRRKMFAFSSVYSPTPSEVTRLRLSNMHITFMGFVVDEESIDFHFATHDEACMHLNQVEFGDYVAELSQQCGPLTAAYYIANHY